MVTVSRREPSANDPLFTNGPRVYTPMTRPCAGGMVTVDLEMMGETLEEHYANPQLTLPQRVRLERWLRLGPIEPGTVEESLKRERDDDLPR
jgi:hypothetical protein